MGPANCRNFGQSFALNTYAKKVGTISSHLSSLTPYIWKKSEEFSILSNEYTSCIFYPVKLRLITLQVSIIQLSLVAFTSAGIPEPRVFSVDGWGKIEVLPTKRNLRLLNHLLPGDRPIEFLLDPNRDVAIVRAAELARILSGSDDLAPAVKNRGFRLNGNGMFRYLVVVTGGGRVILDIFTHKNHHGRGMEILRADPGARFIEGYQMSVNVITNTKFRINDAEGGGVLDGLPRVTDPLEFVYDFRKMAIDRLKRDNPDLRTLPDSRFSWDRECFHKKGPGTKPQVD